MPVKIVYPGYVEIMGIGRVLLASPSAAYADLHVGQIAEEAALTSKTFGVIGRLARDSESPETDSLSQGIRQSIEGFLLEDGIRYVMEIEGKTEPGVEVMIAEERTCSDSTLELVRSRLEKEFVATPTKVVEKGLSNDLTVGLSKKDAKGGFLVETVRVAFGSEERQFSKEKVIRVVSEIAELLNGRAAPSLAD